MEKWIEKIISNIEQMLDNWMYIIGFLSVLFIAFLIVVAKKDKMKTRFITRVGVLVAVTVVLKQLTYTFGSLGRVEFVHIPIIVAGFIYGPVTGILVGFLGDFLGGLLAGLAPFPIIFPFGYALVGLSAGLAKYIAKNSPIRLIICLVAIFILTNYVIEFATYAIHQTQILGVDIRVVLTKYFGARVSRIVWQLPLFLFALAPIVRRTNKAVKIKK